MKSLGNGRSCTIRTYWKNKLFDGFSDQSRPLGSSRLGTRGFRLLYRAHLFAGIFVSVHCLVLFLSGALLLFKNEIQSLASNENAIAEEVTVAPQVYETIRNDVTTRFPTDRVLSIAIDEENPTLLQVRSGLNGSREFRGARRLVYDARTGHEIERREDGGGFFDWLLDLHRDLLLGANGKLYVGFVGLVYLFTLISGAFIYGGFMKTLTFAELRRLTWRSFFADLHKFVGASLLFWGLLIGATGTLLAFNSTLLKIYQSTELRALNAKYAEAAPANAATASLAAVVGAAEAAKPEGVLSFIAFPDTQFSVPNHFIMLFHGREGFAEKLIELVIVDAVTGTVSEVRELPLYLKTLVLSEPLHFGDYGGWPLKLLWLAFTLAFLVMPISGLLIFAEKQRRGRTAVTAPAKSTRLPAPWSRPFLLPAVFFVLTAIALTAALAGDGAIDAAAALIGAIPVLFVLFVSAILLRRRRKEGA